MNTADLRQDLQNRWAPSPEQVEAAEALMAESGAKHVFTLHLLVNKEWGIWTDKVTVEHLPGVYLTRDEATGVLDAAAKARHEKAGEDVVGGYASHTAGGSWAVWDDIVATYPREG